MALHFNRVGPATAELEIWSASERGFSFMVSHESSCGTELHGQPGFAAAHPYQQAHQGGRDHPLRRSPRPSRTVRPCWTTWLGSFGFWRTLALADG